MKTFPCFFHTIYKAFICCLVFCAANIFYHPCIIKQKSFRRESNLLWYRQQTRHERTIFLIVLFCSSVKIFLCVNNGKRKNAEKQGNEFRQSMYDLVAEHCNKIK